MTKRWVLIGDQMQLNPLVKNESSTLKISLFEKLVNKFPEKTTKLIK